MEMMDLPMSKIMTVKQLAAKLLETDAYLIECILKENDKNAAEVLIERHYKTVYKEIYIYVSDKEQALDLTQDTFVTVLRALNQFDESKASFKTWLKRIAHNKVVDYQRSRQHREDLLTAVLEDNEKESPNVLEDAAINHMMSLEVDEMLKREPEEVRRIFNLKVKEGYTFWQISQMLGISESTVKRKYYTVTTKMRKEMQDYE